MVQAISPVMQRVQPAVQPVQAVAQRPAATYIPTEENLTEVALRRRESRIQRSTAEEIEDLHKMEKTGVMAPEKAQALKAYALASMQIDLKQPPSGLTKKPNPAGALNVVA
ncbi:MAG: hypothetical protein PHE78_05065 [Candidatus Gastranaerophilales bacterium]|nr:hypothetical protein [Candidatus Gastranaerophilales bacterium]